MLPITPGDHTSTPIAYIDGPRFDAIALAGHHDELERFLHSPGPDARDEQDQTVLMRSARSGDLLTVVRLLSLGADPLAVDPHGTTALHCAAVSGDAGITGCLIDAGAPVDARDDQSRTPLWLAASHHLPESEVVDTLLRSGADPHLRDRNGTCPEDLL